MGGRSSQKADFFGFFMPILEKNILFFIIKTYTLSDKNNKNL